MRILVTGAAGFIGSVLCHQLIEADHDVGVVDAGWFGTDHLPRDGRLVVLGDDVRIINPPGRWDAVIHLAGISNDPTANWNPQLNYDLNVIGTVSMVDWAKLNGIDRFVYASTHSVYGQPDVVAKEGTVPVAKGPYPESKLFAEDLVADLPESVILRLGTVHGVSPRMRYDLMVNTFARDCFRGVLKLDGGGKDWRPVLDVRDAARAFLWAATAPAETVAGETFNIARQNIRVNRVAHLIADVYEVLYNRSVDFLEMPPRKVGRSQEIDILKATNAGFRAKHDLVDCLVALFNLTERLDTHDARYYNIRWVTELLGEPLAAGSASEAEKS